MTIVTELATISGSEELARFWEGGGEMGAVWKGKETKGGERVVDFRVVRTVG